MVWSCYNYFVGTEDEEAWFRWLWELSRLVNLQMDFREMAFRVLCLCWNTLGVRYHRIYSLISNKQIYDNWTSFVVSDSLLYTYPGRYGHCHYAGISPESLFLWWPGTRTRTVEWQQSALIRLGFKVNQDPGKDTGRREEGRRRRYWQELLLWLGQPGHVPTERLWTDKGWLCDHRASVLSMSSLWFPSTSRVN